MVDNNIEAVELYWRWSECEIFFHIIFMLQTQLDDPGLSASVCTYCRHLNLILGSQSMHIFMDIRINTTLAKLYLLSKRHLSESVEVYICICIVFKFVCVCV